MNRVDRHAPWRCVHVVLTVCTNGAEWVRVYISMTREAFPRAGRRHRSSAGSQRVPGPQGTLDEESEEESDTVKAILVFQNILFFQKM